MSIIENTPTTSGVIEHIDPNRLVIEANVRPSAALTVEFIQSIKASCVITPILARRDEHGNVLVRSGQRRTLGAREAGVATIPVYVIDADETTTDRSVQQMIENDQREALTTADHAAVLQQLSFEGRRAEARQVGPPSEGGRTRPPGGRRGVIPLALPRARTGVESVSAAGAATAGR